MIAEDQHRTAGLHLPGDLERRALRDPAAIARRHALLATRPPHMGALMDYVADLRHQQPERRVPDFDPAGGGMDALVLFLLEKPGPKADRARGSGLLSICNDDPAAAATHDFAIGINRLDFHWLLFANVIPWWNGTTDLTAEQPVLSPAAISDLLRLLPALRAIVLVGLTAQRVWDRSGLEPPAGTTMWRSYHPGPQVRGRNPDMWNSIPSAWPDRAWIERGTHPDTQAVSPSHHPA